MFRSLALIVSAIQLTRPQVPEDQALAMAKVLQEEAKEHHFDPFSGVAMIHFESGFRPEVVSPNREDYGLGQIRARYVGACRKDKDPLNHPSKACLQVKKDLLDPTKNIRLMAEMITRHRKLCRKKTRTARFDQWLASYQGLNFPKQGRWCKANKRTWRVIHYRRTLIRKLIHRRK